MRFLLYPVLWVVHVWWLLVDGHTRYDSRTSAPHPNEIIEHLEAAYPKVALIERERRGRNYAVWDVRRRRIKVFAAILIYWAVTWVVRHG